MPTTLSKPTNVLWIVVLVVGIAAGCQPPGASTAQDGGEAADAGPSIEDDVVASPRLPAMYLAGYGEPWPAIDMCTWATTVDAVVFGTLVAIRLSDEPMVQRASSGGVGAWEWVTECEAPSFVVPTLELDLDATAMPLGDAPAALTVRMSIRQRESYRPLPHPGITLNEVEWVTGGGDTVPLMVGQELGMAAHYVPSDDVWLLMGEALFDLSAAGTIEFQSRGGVLEPPPTGVPGLTLDELRDSLAGCEETADSERRKLWVTNAWGPADGTLMPSDYMAAYCSRQ